jgi:hypothetical protein
LPTALSKEDEMITSLPVFSLLQSFDGRKNTAYNHRFYTMNSTFEERITLMRRAVLIDSSTAIGIGDISEISSN